jgi:hypothetical protein
VTVLIVLSVLISWDLAGVLLIAVCGLGPIATLVGARRISRVEQP